MKHVDQPRESYLKLRAWRRARHWTPARIYRPLPLDPWTGELLDRHPPLLADFGDHHEIDRFAIIQDIWNYGHIIDQEEFEWLKAMWPLTKRLKPEGVRLNAPRGILP